MKFALGENVTRSPRRFPNTRMGVESVIERAFEEGRAYRAVWNEYNKAKATKRAEELGPPPRVDLRLEALAGILDGSIKIHSHCYRSDEILMLLRTAQKYGVRVQSLQHVLEGYKVAAEIAAHGASASTFSDWWAYKIEAYDAIPFNAALLTEAGASVCIKSDDAELMRHLNLEAAKMVKYGGVSETQALAMITINPARELGLDGRLGSIEVGKDADIAIFNGHPFDAFSRCELALIDGEVYFQRHEPGGGFGVRPGDHTAMPVAPESARNRTIDIAAQPKNLFALIGANLHPVSGPEIKGGDLDRRRRPDRGDRGRRHDSDSRRGPDRRAVRPGRLAGHGGRRVDDRAVRGRQPDGDPGLCRRSPVSTRAAQQHGPAPRQRTHPGDTRQRDPDDIRGTLRRNHLGPGMPDQSARLGSS